MMPANFSIKTLPRTLLLPSSKLGLIVGLVTSLVIVSSASQAAMSKDEDKPPTFEVNGRVLDYQGSPAHNIPVRLLNENGEELGKTQSGKDGSFVISHQKCQSCALQILPPLKSGLASAFINNLPGAADR